MSYEQIVLFIVMGGVLLLLLWGRWRYDLVAFTGLVVAVLFGVVDAHEAFAGFGHPAVIIVALVLVVSKGLERAGVVDMITRHLVSGDRPIWLHILLLGGIGAALSAFMNNVAALAMLMPVDLAAAVRARRSPSLTLMPLSFATILGGMTTMIGTPTNIVIAQFRAESLGASYGMFDFTSVGLPVALCGVAFVAFLGWRLVPVRKRSGREAETIAGVDPYIAELTVGSDARVIGHTFGELKREARKADVWLISVVRRGERQKSLKDLVLRKGDVLIVEGRPEDLEQFAAALMLDWSKSHKHARLLADAMSMLEAVVPREARIVNRSADDVRLLARHGVVLAGISRQGRAVRERVRKTRVRPGDLLLLMGPDNVLEETALWLGALPLKRRKDLSVSQRQKAWLAIGLFALAIVAAAGGFVYLPVGLGAVVVAFAFLRILPLSRIYDAVEWPVIVLLASLIPLGATLESVGGTQLLAKGLLALTQGWSPVVVLILMMVVTMTLSDVLNNVATVLIAAPVAVSVAKAMGVNPDTMLMGVAVAASCAFLTPVGHKNNTIVMGPGAYVFGDYWRMGLPLEVIVLAVSLPLILLVWPF